MGYYAKKAIIEKNKSSVRWKHMEELIRVEFRLIGHKYGPNELSRIGLKD